MKLTFALGLLLVVGLCLADPLSTSEEKGSSSSEDNTRELNIEKRDTKNKEESSSSSSSSSEENNDVQPEKKEKLKENKNSSSSSSSSSSEEKNGHHKGERSLDAQIQEMYQKTKAVKRVVRDAGLTAHYLPILESSIISNCKLAGNSDAASKLQETYDAMKVCLRKKTMYYTPKDEYIQHLENCSQTALVNTKSCLASDQKYFPEFILDLAKSVVNLLYDDREYMRTDLAPCLPKFNEYNVQREYIQCLTDISVRAGHSSQIPLSKAAFCLKFIPASQCFTDMIKNNCENSENLDKFRNDYMAAITHPCDKKEA